MRVKHKTRPYFATVHVETPERIVYSSQARTEEGQMKLLQKWNCRQPARFWAEWETVGKKEAKA